MCGKRTYNRRFFMNASYRSARTSFIGEWSVADVQPGGQVENHFAGDARCKKKKKDVRISKFKIECHPTERIFWSSPIWHITEIDVLRNHIWLCKQPKLCFLFFQPIRNLVCMWIDMDFGGLLSLKGWGSLIQYCNSSKVTEISYSIFNKTTLFIYLIP